MISLVINCDTRPGAELPVSAIGDFSAGSLQGVRSFDLLTEGIRTKNKFFAGHDIETLVFIDIHLPIPEDVQTELDAMVASGEITTLVCQEYNRKRHKWNDHIYLHALREAKGDYIVHFDGDVCAFRKDDYTVVDKYFDLLENGYKYICQPTQITDHGMLHASTRFFICKRETLDLDEVERCLDDNYRRTTHGDRHCPCLEHILGLLVNDGEVLYPEADNENYCVFSWVSYHKGVLSKLNNTTYNKVYDYVFTTCGGLHGASDLTGELI